MRTRQFTILSALILLLNWGIRAQVDTASCKSYLYDMEKQFATYMEDSLSTMHMKYRTTNETWNNERFSSRVEFYAQGENLHYWSSKANVFKDEEHTLYALKDQRIVLLQPTPQVDKNKVTELNGLARTEFIRSGKVTGCEVVQDRMVIKIETSESMEEYVAIKYTEYQLDVKTGAFISSRTHFREKSDYKTITFVMETMEHEDDYTFKRPSSYLLDRNRRPKGIYKGYQFVDQLDAVVENE